LNQVYKYKYEILNTNDHKYPEYIILTNVNIEKKYKLHSETKVIFNKLIKNGYVLKVRFTPHFKYLFLFTNELNYYMAAIVQSPVEINIYEKRK